MLQRNKNKSTASLNVLSCKPVVPFANKPTKAQKFFQQSAQLPKSLANEMMLSSNNPDVDGRPSKPINTEVEVPDENDPFYQIEKVTNKIGHLMTNYEEQSQLDHYAMLQELDSNFQINNLDHREILDESRKTVNELMNKTKVLKETQVGMLDDLSTWFSREEKSLKEADITSNTAVDMTVAVTTDDLLEVLNSSAGTSQERVSKAIALHGDIVSKAYIKIHQLERKNHEQEKLVNDLQRQVMEMTPKVKRKQTNQTSSDKQKQLQLAMTRISSQEETIKKLNERIEQLIGQSVLQHVTSETNVSDESALLKTHDLLSMELQLDKKEALIQSQKDEIFKLKHDIQTLEADKTFLESQAFTYQEKIELEKQRYDSLQRQFLETFNNQQDSEQTEKKPNPLVEQVLQLEAEVKKLRDQLDSEKKASYAQMEARIKDLKREFEVRELELKKRQLGSAIGGSHQAVYEALQAQHDNEMSVIKKNYEEQISEMKKNFEQDKKNFELQFNEKMKDFQKQLQNQALASGGNDAGKYIDALQKQYEEKEAEMKRTMMERLDSQREGFRKEVDKRDDEINRLTAELEELRMISNMSTAEPTARIKEIESPKIEEDDAQKEMDNLAEMELNRSGIPPDFKEQVNDLLAKYAKEMDQKYRTKMYNQKQKIDEFWQQQLRNTEDRLNFEIETQKEESEATIAQLNTIIAELEGKESAANIESIRSEFLDQINRANEIESQNKKLTVENQLLKAQLSKGNDDFTVIELTQALAEQTNELNELRAKMSELKNQLKETEDKLLSAHNENAKFRKKQQSIKSMSVPFSSSPHESFYEYCHQDLFQLSIPLQKGLPEMKVEGPHSYFMYYEITTSIEPRLQEHMKMLKSRARFDPKSILFFENCKDKETVLPSEPVVMIDNGDYSFYLLDNEQVKSKKKNKLYVSPMRLFCINEDPKQNEPIIQYITKKDSKPKIILSSSQQEIASIFMLKPKLKMMKKILIVDNEPPPEKVCSKVYPMKLDIPPLSDEDLLLLLKSRENSENKESKDNNEKEEHQNEKKEDEENHSPKFSRVVQLSIQKDEVVSVSPFISEPVDVAVQVMIENQPEIKIREPLTHMPPLEIFGVNGIEIRPDEPVICDPSVHFNGINNQDQFDEDNQKKYEIQLLTHEGDLIDIPPIQSIDATTDLNATKIVSQMTIDDTQAMNNRLQLVVSELQSINQEPDPVKRMQLQETLGVSLDVEKDSLISQMRERITELEQMMNRVADDPSPSPREVSQFQTVSISPEESTLSIIPHDSEIDKDTVAIVTNRVESETQTDKTESEEVGTTTMDFTTPDDITPVVVDENPKVIITEKPVSLNVSQNLTVANVIPETSSVEKKNTKLEFSGIESSIIENTKVSQSQIVTSHVIENIAPKIVLTSETSVSPMPQTPISEFSAHEIETNNTENNETNTNDIESVEKEKNLQLNISAPFQILEMADTVDLSTEYGVQFEIKPKSPEIIETNKMVLQVDNSVSCEFGDTKVFTFSNVDQFSAGPKKKASLLATETVIEIGERPIGNRASSPIPIYKVSVGINHSSGKVQEGKQLMTEITEKGSKRMALNMNNVKVARTSAQMKILTKVTKDIANVAPEYKKGDPKIMQIQNQAEQISELKKQLLQLQLSSPEEMPKIISVVNHTMNNISNGLDSIETDPAVVISKSKGTTARSNVSNINKNHSSMLLREAIETTDGLAKSMINYHTSLMNNQSSIFARINEATNQFLKEMDQPGGATTEKQSRFLRSVNDVAAEISETISTLEAEIAKNNELKISLHQAKDQLKKTEKFLEDLQKENLDLKMGSGKSQLVKQLINARKDLINLMKNETTENQFIKSENDAQKIIPKIANRGKNDNNARQAGASAILDRIIKLSSEEKPNWTLISDLINEAITLLEENDAKKKARSIIDKLNIDIKALQAENQRLQTDMIISDRDFQVTKSKLNSQIEQLQRSLDIANEHSAMLERQLGTHQLLQKSMESESKVRALENELNLARHDDKQHYDELMNANKRLSELTTEVSQLKDELQKSKDRYAMLFSQATDTQTTNEALKNRTDEILQQAEIAAQRAKALDQMRSNASQEADDLADQLTEATAENAKLKNLIVLAQQKINNLENEVLNEKANKIIVGGNGKNGGGSSDAPKIFKAYQQRIEQYMGLLTKHGNDLIDLRARHATDQKSLILMKRENRKTQNDLKMQNLRYECSKQENSLLQKSLAARDETIRALKREIERLRSLLAMQGPLKQKIIAFEKEKNDAEKAVIQTQEVVEQTKAKRDKFANKNPVVTNYFDGLLRRQQETLARLERKRKEMRELDEKNKLATLRAVSQVVHMAELQIPEEVILKMMPRPQPVAKLQRHHEIEERKKISKIEEANLMKEVEEINNAENEKLETEIFLSTRSAQPSHNLNDKAAAALSMKKAKAPSYADTLQMIGSLVDQKSPRTLQEMLRNARHSRIVIPVQQNPPHRRKDVPNLLSIKPMRK
ncbi:hypothetical protein TRFO_35649 [Tritrichomonas foetus]|uniref:Uncharacterized protein n=1 Tax=Tritrichomonas foetus TaxID=1144522 RepID=A0A1J4JI84_9EUKA|nr:hypothetical protein TRFO_35649 [Tritrichomonas foetus]|eukprot:OHS98039.1 hypothetical protein TRFO_35649 [Tritrichomonas foetus]